MDWIFIHRGSFRIAATLYQRFVRRATGVFYGLICGQDLAFSIETAPKFRHYQQSPPHLPKEKASFTPALKPHSFFPGFMVQSPHQPKEARDESGKALRKIGSGGGGHIAAGEGR
jgi:hypothetical protein